MALDPAAKPTERLGRFEVLGNLAKGGMAEVLLGRGDGPRTLARPVVIKRILPHLASDEQFVRMFFAEAKVAALINHPNVVAIHQLGEDPKSRSYYMVMEFVDGVTLKRVLRQAHEAGDPLPLPVAARIVADICGGLDHAHGLADRNGAPLHLVHRDISLENILVGFNGRPKLSDFGIAKTAAADRLTKNGQIKGKTTYMAPEQVLGRELDRRADIWALGVGLYWLASGRRPFVADTEVDTLTEIVKGPLPAFPAGIDPRFAKIVARALEKRPDDRFGTALELGEALSAWIAATGAAAGHAEVRQELARRFPPETDPDRKRVSALLAIEPEPVTLLNLAAARDAAQEERTILDRQAPLPAAGLAPTALSLPRAAVKLEPTLTDPGVSPRRVGWGSLAIAALLVAIFGVAVAIVTLDLRDRTPRTSLGPTPIVASPSTATSQVASPLAPGGRPNPENAPDRDGLVNPYEPAK